MITRYWSWGVQGPTFTRHSTNSIMLFTLILYAYFQNEYVWLIWLKSPSMCGRGTLQAPLYAFGVATQPIWRLKIRQANKQRFRTHVGFFLMQLPRIFVHSKLLMDYYKIRSFVSPSIKKYSSFRLNSLNTHLQILIIYCNEFVNSILIKIYFRKTSTNAFLD